MQQRAGEKFLWQKEKEGEEKEWQSSKRERGVLPLMKGSAQNGTNFMGKVQMKGRQKPHGTSISNISSPCMHPHLLPGPQSVTSLEEPEPSCWPWASWDTLLVPWLLLALPTGTCIPQYCHPVPGQYTQVLGQLLLYSFQSHFQTGP